MHGPIGRWDRDSTEGGACLGGIDRSAPGQIRTKEGETHHEAGAYLVFNQEDGGDGCTVSAAKFRELYEAVPWGPHWVGWEMEGEGWRVAVRGHSGATWKREAERKNSKKRQNRRKDPTLTRGRKIPTRVLAPSIANVLDCGSPLPLFIPAGHASDSPDPIRTNAALIPPGGH